MLDVLASRIGMTRSAFLRHTIHELFERKYPKRTCYACSAVSTVEDLSVIGWRLSDGKWECPNCQAKKLP